jgi:hypothetical protein
LVRKSASARPGIGGTAGHEPVCHDRGAVAEPAPVGVDHARLGEAAEGAHHLDSLGLEMLGRVAHAGPVDHRLHPLHHAGKVDRRLGRLDAEPVRVAHVVGALRGGDQALRRDAAREEAVTARLLGLLNERHPGAHARRVERGDKPRSTAAEDNQS